MAGTQDERRIVTALFADVVGSTAMSERLPPEEAKLIIGEAISRAIQTVETYGGTINKLLGDGVLALFGAPLAHEDDPERAVRAGLDIIAMADTYAREVERGWGVEGFAIRCGIHSGEVVVGQLGAGDHIEYGAIGDTMNTAARLQAAAPENGILVSDVTRRQIEYLFDWGERQVLTLKGKGEPLTAFLVTGLRGQPPAEAPVPPIVGRNPELATVDALLNLLGSGRGAVLFIIGEPGIGKTRLAAELHDRAIQRVGCAWMEGRCVSYGEALPYWPYRDLLRNWLEVGPSEPELRVRVKLRRKVDELLPEAAAQTYPYLATVLGVSLEPDASAQLKPLSPESLQFRTFEVFTQFLEQMTRLHPVVVTLDDLHWADPTSLALTERLLALAERRPLLLIVLQRPETEHASWLLKEKAARDYRHRFRELALQPLGEEPETELLSSLVGSRTLPSPIKDKILGYAGGNPFYLEQMIRSLIDSGALVPRNSHWELKSEAATVTIPSTLEGVIIARIDRLDPLWRDVMTSASVLGRTFSQELVGSVTGLEPAEVQAAIHHLLRLDLFREEAAAGRTVYRFTHALIQETANKTLVRSRRTMLHRRAAEWYESYYEGRLERVYGLLAHHWQHTENTEKAARYLRLAGDRALGEWALDEAADHFRALVPLLEQAGRRDQAAETLFQLAATLHLNMRFREANATWQRAFAEWTPPARPVEPGMAALRIASDDVPKEPDPARGSSSEDLLLQDQLYDSLFEGRFGPYIVPRLALRWEVSDDGRRYRIELDPAARRNNGTPIRAADVVESFRTILDPAVGSPEASGLAALKNARRFASGEIKDFGEVGIRALDDLTIDLRLGSPAPHWIFVMLLPGLAGAKDGQSSGPYQVVRLEPDRAVIAMDNHYRSGWGGNVGTVEWVVTRRRFDPLEALLRGEIDVAHQIHMTPPVVEAVESGRLIAVTGPPVSTAYVVFTGIAPNRLDVHMRRALAHAIDRRRLEPYLGADQLIAGGGLVPPGLPGHTPDTALPFNPDLARESLRRSAHRGPIRLAIFRRHRAFWEPLFACWRDVLGITGETLMIDSATTDVAKSAHACLVMWGADYPDPESLLHMLLHSHGSSNFSGWSSPEFDALIDRAVEQESGADRLAFFHEADRLAVQRECSVIPLFYWALTTVHQPWVHGWSWTSGWGDALRRFDELSVDDRSPRAQGLDQFDYPSVTLPG